MCAHYGWPLCSAPRCAGKYWVDPYTLFWIEAILMNFAELKRWQVRLVAAGLVWRMADG